MSEQENTGEVIPPNSATPDGWHEKTDEMGNLTFSKVEQGEHRQTMRVHEVAQYLNAVDMVIASNKNYIARLDAENDRLLTEQIDGSDHRLADFWAKAQELADRDNHCEIFDNIAEALGGPRRETEEDVTITGVVTVPFSYTIRVSAPEGEHEERAQEIFDDSMSGSDLEDYADWYSADIDDYSTEANL